MNDVVTRGSLLKEIAFVDDAKGLEVYGVKGGKDWRAIVDAAGGIASHDRLQTVEDAQTAGMVGYATLSELSGNLTPPDGALAKVTNDPTPANNGTWRKDGAVGAGVWVKSADEVSALEARAAELESVNAGARLTAEEAASVMLAGRAEAIEEFVDPLKPRIEPDGALGWLFGVVDESGRILMAVDRDGRLHTRFQDFDQEFATADGRVFGVVDASGRAVLTVEQDGMLASVAGVRTPGFELAEYDTVDGRVFVITDAAGRVLFEIGQDGTVTGSPEVADARGTHSTLDGRLSAYLTPEGMPRLPVWGEWNLRRTFLALRRLKVGLPEQLRIACIGDSWTFNRYRFVRDFIRQMSDGYGYGGPGWVGFYMHSDGTPQASADDAVVAVTHAGAWTMAPAVVASPDVGETTTDVAGDKITVTHLGAGTVSTAKLFHLGSAGTIRYRWDGGAWTSVDLSLASGLTIEALAEPPPGPWVLEIENVSGITTLCGMRLAQADDGVVVHKLGRAGAGATHFATPDATQWQAGIAELAPQLVTILLGTNDQASITPAVFKDRVGAVISRTRAAIPNVEILLVAPCENDEGRPTPMTDYAAAMYQLAVEHACAFIDLQYTFGAAPDDYMDLFSDTVHPAPETGGTLVADCLLRLIAHT